MRVEARRIPQVKALRGRPGRRSRATPYLFLLPAFLTLAIIVLFPLGFSFYLSVHKYILTRPFDRGFVGLANFSDSVTDPIFWSSLIRTLIWVGAAVGGQLVVGLAVALYLNQRFPAREVLRGIVLIPWVTPSVVVAIAWVWMLDANFGVINDLLVRLGVLSAFRPWLSNPTTAFPAVILAAIWQGTPFFAIMLLAALQTIPPEILEAAPVDGASPMQTFFYITLPIISPTILITTLLRTIWMANYVDLIFMMTRGGPGYATNTLSIWTLLTVRGGLDFGHGSALALLLGVLLVAPVTFYVIALRKQEILA